MSKEKLETLEQLMEDLNYLYSKINWGKSFLDAEAIAIMNELGSRIKAWHEKEIRLAEQRLIEKVREGFVRLAIQGKDDSDDLKGSLLYTRTLSFLDQLEDKEVGGE